MDVVHVSSAHPYTDNRIHYRECVTLYNSGFEVALIAVSTPTIGPESKVRVFTIPHRKRLQRMLFSSAHAVYLAIKTKAPIVHLHDPELIPYIPFFRILGKKVIYDAHEDLPNQALNKPYLSKLAARIASGASSILLQITRFATLCVAATETIAEKLPSRNVVTVHNYPPLRVEEELVTSRSINHRQNQVVYVGGISELRGSIVMMQAMGENIIPKGWRMALAGPSSDSELADLSAHPGWANVDFYGEVGPEFARNLILESQIGLVVLANTPAYRESLPVKMFEYFAAGLPVIASDFPLWRKLVRDNECGLLVNPGSPHEVALAIRKYAENPELLSRHSENARNLALSKFNWQSEGETLISAYKIIYNSI